MKTIELIDSHNVKHIFNFTQAEAMLQLGSNCMLKVRIPEDSNYYYDVEARLIKRKHGVKQVGNTKKDRVTKSKRSNPKGS